MTGRELVLYILENGLEDEPVYQNGRLLGFMSVNDAAVELNVGPATIKAMIKQQMLEGIYINGLYIPKRSVKE